MNANDPLLGAPGWSVIGIYLIVLLGLGFWGRYARREDTLSDFFLGGRKLGMGVLLLTLYASQYSGNTLVGYTGTAYRSGFAFLMAVPFMMGVIGVYLLYAPKLQLLSKQYQFITPADYLQQRYQHHGLSRLVALSGVVALANFLITNLKAIGEIATQATGGAVTPSAGILLFAAGILIYEMLGGLRSVAWSDVLQGILLLTGCLTVLGVTLAGLGGISSALERLHAVRPDFWTAPDLEGSVQWVSTIVIVAFGAAMYPHAIQRIYAAKNAQVLRRSLQIMVFMPLVTTLVMVVIGILGNVTYPGLDRAASEGVVLLILHDFAQAHTWGHWIAALFVAAVLAAIMSSADSALLSIASSVTKDFVRPLTQWRKEAHLTFVGKGISIGVMALCVMLAITLPQNIWQLIQIKTELLAQTAPAFICGLHWKRLPATAVFAGFLVGTGITLFLLLGNFIFPESIQARPLNLHAGLWGLGCNLLTIAISALRSTRIQNP